jgi:hypothetical protein
MTLGELIESYRPHLLDETVSMQRSWEDTFKYALKVFPANTPLDRFDLRVLEAQMSASGINQRYADGYIERWRRLLVERAAR